MTDDANDRTCEMCESCEYIGEGDFVCDERGFELVIANWIPQRESCEKWTEWRDDFDR